MSCCGSPLSAVACRKAKPALTEPDLSGVGCQSFWNTSDMKGNLWATRAEAWLAVDLAMAASASQPKAELCLTEAQCNQCKQKLFSSTGQRQPGKQATCWRMSADPNYVTKLSQIIPSLYGCLTPPTE